ncbi:MULTISPECIES: hypothetical protein [Citricoccus]|uniref:Uncharacterized protein n=1 Tax=Citricoccus parietis TaxID=592307 RepID=A0ABV6F0I5_9MICC|nr:hypothetical protein [Citricoccus sp. K5]VXC17745.1 hypothetical protein CITRIK5_70912 [Citricoccus sp. K5]
MESVITEKLSELLSSAPESPVVVDMHLHREPVTVVFEPQD